MLKIKYCESVFLHEEFATTINEIKPLSESEVFVESAIIRDFRIFAGVESQAFNNLNSSNIKNNNTAITSTNRQQYGKLQNVLTKKITMFSINSTKTEFSINFSKPIPANKIALTKLRVHFSWPNIRSEAFDKLPRTNSLTFSYKKDKDGTPDWQVMLLSTGTNETEQINEEIQRRIKVTTVQEAQIEITAHQAMLSSAVEIKKPKYMVNIDQSSMRTVLW